MKGILAGAMSGFGEGLQRASGMAFQGYLQQQAAEIQRLRDDRLAEIREQAEIRGEERKRAPYQRAARAGGEAIRGATRFDEDAAGNVTRNDPTAAERARLRARAYEAEGLPDVASGLRSEAMTAEERDFERGFRRSQLGETKRYHDASIRRQAEELKLREKTESRLSAVAEVQLRSARFELEGKQEIRDLQRAIERETDPTKRAQHERQLLTRLGKAKELPEPVKVYVEAAKAEIGKLAEQEALMGGDLPRESRARLAELRQQMRNLAVYGTMFPAPSDDDIAGLRSRANNSAAVEFFERTFGAGSAKRYLGGQPKSDADKPKLPGDRILPATQAASRHASAAAAQESRASVGTPGNTGERLDRAREQVREAREHLMTYGSLKIKRDNEGYKAARAAYERAQAAENEAEKKYRASLGHIGAYRGLESADEAFERGFRTASDRRSPK